MFKKYFTKTYFKGQRLMLLTFLVLHTVASYYYISKQNITFDEPQYIEYAKRWLHGKPERIESLDDSKSPVIAICWVPRMIRQIINPPYQLNDFGRKDQEEGRHMMILFSFLTAIYVYWWCRELYGNKGWWLPLLLLLFDPLYLAYSALIITDLACATFLVALLYHYRKYIVYHSRKDFYWASFYIALGIVTKQTLLFVLLLLPILTLVHFFIEKNGKRFNYKRALTDMLFMTVIVIAVINIMYYFHKTFIPFGNYVFESNTFQNLQHSLSFLHWLPVPLPEGFVQSSDMLKAHAELGAGKSLSTYNGVYLFGELKITGGIWYYYLVMFFYKMPVGTMLLMLAASAIFFKKFKSDAFAKTYQFVVVPVIFFWFILSFVNQFQTGIRHLLLVFPLLYIGLGYLFMQIEKSRFFYKALAGIAIGYSFISIAVYYPYLIAYTNEFIWNKKTVYRKISDSSINYGQSDSSVTEFLAAHPVYKKASQVPAAGKFIVGMNRVCNTYLPHLNPYTWYDQLEPIGQYKYVFVLYNISDEDLIKIKKNVPFPRIR